MNWSVVEEKLYTASTAALDSFLREHPAERFYGFIFDVNADYGEVLLCLNTEAALHQWATSHYPSWSSPEVDRKLRWNAGDWEYQGFNNETPSSAQWEQTWSEVQESIASASLDDDDISERFLESVCRVLLRLERSQEFLRINREPHFRTLVSDHDEDLQDSWARLERVRAAG